MLACPIDGEKLRCTDTRVRAKYVCRRRYECPKCKTRYWSIERLLTPELRQRAEILQRQAENIASLQTHLLHEVLLDNQEWL